MILASAHEMHWRREILEVEIPTKWLYYNLPRDIAEKSLGEVDNKKMEGIKDKERLRLKSPQVK